MDGPTEDQATPAVPKEAAANQSACEGKEEAPQLGREIGQPGLQLGPQDPILGGEIFVSATMGSLALGPIVHLVR